jgi:TDG/mug DNA glycosylase family protein
VRVFSFSPVVAADARVLILGSMPGVASLQAAQYYAHPRNQFWRIVAELCGLDNVPDYPQRLQLLRERHLALWDVLHSCVRPGSLDASIEHSTARANDLVGLLRSHPGIVRICCNGGTAFTALRRHAWAELARDFGHVDVRQLPSTSPANASWTYDRKLQAWRQALAAALSPALDVAVPGPR